MNAKQAFATMLANFVGSRKWMGCLVVLAIAGVLVARGAMTVDDWKELAKFVIPSLVLATGVEKIGSPTPATPTASVPSPAPTAGKDAST